MSVCVVQSKRGFGWQSFWPVVNQLSLREVRSDVVTNRVYAPSVSATLESQSSINYSSNRFNFCSLSSVQRVLRGFMIAIESFPAPLLICE